jgi:phage terminase large subunit GpA-like protein
LKAYDFLQRRIFIEGTKQVETKLPWTLREQSTKSRIPCPCPHCGEQISPTRESLMGWQDARNEMEVEENATWVCPMCGEAISDALRREVLADAVLVHDGQEVDKRGRVTGPPPRTRRLWFDYGAWHNCFLSAAAVALECWNAEQYEINTPQRISADRDVTQFTFGEIYKPPQLHDTDLVLPDAVADRRLDLPRNMLPDDTIFWTIGVDMGKRFGHYVCLAIRKCGRLHIPDYGVFDVLLNHTELDTAFYKSLEDLSQQMSAGMATTSGDRIKMKGGAVDRGYVPSPIVHFCSQSKGLWIPVIGRGETQLQKTVYNHPKKKTQTIRQLDVDGRYFLERIQQPARTLQAMVDADGYKRIVASLLSKCVLDESSGLETLPMLTLFSGPAAVHRKFSRHLCSEQEVIIEMVGQPAKREWIQSGANHWLDALAYAIACANWHGFRFSYPGAEAA